MAASEHAMFTDDDLATFIDSLPDEAELLEELSALSKLPGALPERRCLACNSSLALLRKDALYCSHACRQWAYEQRLSSIEDGT